jgi:hypothetical protein
MILRRLTLWAGLLALLFAAGSGSAQVGVSPITQAGSGTACVGITIGSTSISCGGSAGTLTGVTFGWSLGTWSTQSGTTYTLASSDCGTGIKFTNASAITVTVPATLPVGCNVALKQQKEPTAAGKVSTNGTAVAAATIDSPHGYTGTYAAGSVIGINIDTNSGGSAAVGSFLGDGS